VGFDYVFDAVFFDVGGRSAVRAVELH